MKLEFKKATLCDIELIRTLADEIFHKTYADLISSEQMEYMFDWMYSLVSLRGQMESGHKYFVAYDNAEPCGFFSVELKDAERHFYYLQKLYLLPAYHGTGAGEALFGGVVDYVRGESPNIAVLQLNVNRENKRALSFYEKQGMLRVKAKDVEIAEGFYMRDYIMEIEFESLREDGV